MRDGLMAALRGVPDLFRADTIANRKVAREILHAEIDSYFDQAERFVNVSIARTQPSFSALVDGTGHHGRVSGNSSKLTIDIEIIPR